MNANRRYGEGLSNNYTEGNFSALREFRGRGKKINWAVRNYNKKSNMAVWDGIFFLKRLVAKHFNCFQANVKIDT